MRINSEVQAPRQPVRERQPAPAEATREKAPRVEEKQPAPRQPEGNVGRNLDTQA